MAAKVTVSASGRTDGRFVVKANGRQVGEIVGTVIGLDRYGFVWRYTLYDTRDDRVKVSDGHPTLRKPHTGCAVEAARSHFA